MYPYLAYHFPNLEVGRSTAKQMGQHRVGSDIRWVEKDVATIGVLWSLVDCLRVDDGPFAPSTAAAVAAPWLT